MERGISLRLFLNHLLSPRGLVGLDHGTISTGVAQFPLFEGRHILTSVQIRLAGGRGGRECRFEGRGTGCKEMSVKLH